ncbi:probable phosphatase 2C 60 [Olea europaea subsp. europaea]|uniref:Probable phosphatase 2C 60 n=1 Tax=Olea europaea subsp. europaea TaxID=158383 RepID=A0A8S0R0V2_OLEEU|nr:probable phosphatase 2C 60 [Olea europaea subsp. europaea]
MVSRDCMSSQQLVDFIHEQLKSETKLSKVCEKALDRCLAPSTAVGEGCDNMTMILVQFTNPGPLRASAHDKSSYLEEVPIESKTSRN